MKLQHSLHKLNNILPVKRTLDSLNKPRANIYFAVLHGFYQTGRAPLITELELIDPKAMHHLSHLAEEDMMTLDNHGEVKGCYPFTLEKRVHRIRLNGFEVHAMCALDALAPSSMFHCASRVLSECTVTAKPVHIELDDQTIKNKQEVADLKIGINWKAASSSCSCSDSLCSEMVFLTDSLSARNWLNKYPDDREIYTIDEAIRFAAAFFRPLLQQS